MKAVKDRASTPEAPSIDKYTEMKNQLTQQIIKKQELTKKLNVLEESIYEKEKEYFNESTYGNIVKGFENFFKSSGGGSLHKKRFQYTDEDHIFSLSSVNYVKTIMKRQGYVNGGTSVPVPQSKDDFDDYEDSIEPVGTGAPTTKTEMTATPSRKRKARVLDD